MFPNLWELKRNALWGLKKNALNIEDFKEKLRAA